MTVATPVRRPCRHDCGRLARIGRTECSTCCSRRVRKTPMNQPIQQRRLSPGPLVRARCDCGVLVAEHTKCRACGLLAGDGEPHLIRASDLVPYGRERDLCPLCRRARRFLEAQR